MLLELLKKYSDYSDLCVHLAAGPLGFYPAAFRSV